MRGHPSRCRRCLILAPVALMNGGCAEPSTPDAGAPAPLTAAPTVVHAGDRGAADGVAARAPDNVAARNRIIAHDLAAVATLIQALSGNLEAATDDPVRVLTAKKRGARQDQLRRLKQHHDAASAATSDEERFQRHDELTQALAYLGNSFPSFGPAHESVHDEITRLGLERTGLEPITDAIKESVRRVDWEENECQWQWNLRPTAAYRSAHHFDRPQYIAKVAEVDAHRDAFLAGCSTVLATRQEFVAAFRRGDGSNAVVRLGRALHAMQDLHSHSNWVDLPAADQAASATCSSQPARRDALPSRAACASRPTSRTRTIRAIPRTPVRLHA